MFLDFLRKKTCLFFSFSCYGTVCTGKIFLCFTILVSEGQRTTLIEQYNFFFFLNELYKRFLGWGQGGKCPAPLTPSGFTPAPPSIQTDPQIGVEPETTGFTVRSAMLGKGLIIKDPTLALFPNLHFFNFFNSRLRLKVFFFFLNSYCVCRLNFICHACIGSIAL